MTFNVFLPPSIVNNLSPAEKTHFKMQKPEALILNDNLEGASLFTINTGADFHITAGSSKLLGYLVRLTEPGEETPLICSLNKHQPYWSCYAVLNDNGTIVHQPEFDYTPSESSFNNFWAKVWNKLPYAQILNLKQQQLQLWLQADMAGQPAQAVNPTPSSVPPGASTFVTAKKNNPYHASWIWVIKGGKKEILPKNELNNEMKKYIDKTLVEAMPQTYASILDSLNNVTFTSPPSNT